MRLPRSPAVYGERGRRELSLILAHGLADFQLLTDVHTVATQLEAGHLGGVRRSESELLGLARRHLGRTAPLAIDPLHNLNGGCA